MRQFLCWWCRPSSRHVTSAITRSLFCPHFPRYHSPPFPSTLLPLHISLCFFSPLTEGRRKEEEGWKESIWWLFHPPCCSASNINNHFELFTNCRSALRRLEWAVTRWHKCMYARACVIDFGCSCCVYQTIQSRDHLTGQNTWVRKLIIATKLFSFFSKPLKTIFMNYSLGFPNTASWDLLNIFCLTRTH